MSIVLDDLIIILSMRLDLLFDVSCNELSDYEDVYEFVNDIIFTVSKALLMSSNYF